jgi:hypothetical protein
MVVVGSGCESVQGFKDKTGEATGGGGVVAGTVDGLRAGSERRGWWLVKPTATGRTWADVALQRGGCGANGGGGDGGGRCHTRQIPGWPGYSGCRRCSAMDHRSSGCTGASKSQGQVQQQQQSMQVHAQVQTLQSLVDDEVRQHGEHWARMRIEMALESAKKKSCGTVVGAEQQQQQR